MKMIRKGFLVPRYRKNSGLVQRPSFITDIILFLGVVLLIFTLLFMILNFDEADSIIMIWLPFMIAGTILVFVSQVVNRIYKNRIQKKQKRKIQHNSFYT